MRLYLIILLLLLCIPMRAQKLKTIFTNDTDAVALFFPNTIRQGMTGSKNFTFSYNRETSQHVGIVQGIKGQNSNLLVITDNGHVYSYRLAYRKVLDTLNHFIKADEHIGNAAPETLIAAMDTLAKSPMPIKPDFKELRKSLDRIEFFKKFSSYQLARNKNSLKKRRKGGLVLHLKDLVYDSTEVYALLEIKNRSGIDFEVDYLKVFKVNGNNRRKASYQKIRLNPLYRNNFPEIVKSVEKQAFVVVIPKFTLGDSEKLLFELNEKRGSRLISLRFR